jgi:hypothetical protein
VRVHLLLLLPEVEVPNPDGLVVRGGVEVFAVGVEGEAADPVVVAVEGVQQFSGLAEEQLDEFVPAAGEDEGLEVVGNAVGALLVELLQRVHAQLGRELVLEELRVHQLGAGLALDQQQRLNHVVVRKEPQQRRLLVDVPDDDALVVGPADEGLPVLGDRQPPHPALVASEGLLAVASADFPQADGLVPGAGEDHVALGVEVDVGDVVVVAVERLEAQVVVVDVPQLDGEVGGAGGQVAALVVEVDVVDRV